MKNYYLENLQDFVDQLQNVGVENARRELTLLIAFVQNRPYTDVFFDPHLNAEDYDRLVPLLQRRCKGEPLSKITGQREFWSLPFNVTVDTLDPRPDSETIIQAVLNYFPDRHQTLKLIDFGTGTGCLLLSALSEYPNGAGVGVDISDAALAVAQQNAQQLGLSQRASFAQSNWAENLQIPNGFRNMDSKIRTERPECTKEYMRTRSAEIFATNDSWQISKDEGYGFDVVISNPPYICLNEPLEAAVKEYDPPQALYGGQDGLEAYRALLPQLKRLMHSKSLAFIEIGQGQGDAVRSIGEEAGLICVSTHPDLAGIERVVVFGVERHK